MLNQNSKMHILKSILVAWSVFVAIEMVVFEEKYDLCHQALTIRQIIYPSVNCCIFCSMGRKGTKQISLFCRHSFCVGVVVL